MRVDAEEVRRAQNQLLQALILSGATIVIIQVLPKDTEPASFVRFAYTLIYFGALFGFLLALGKPREEYMRLAHEWRFEDSGPALRQGWQLYLHALSRALHPFLYLLMAFLFTVALRILARWPWLQFLSEFEFAYTYGLYVSLGLLLLYPIVAGSRIVEVLQVHRLLTEHLATDDFVPRALRDLDSVENTTPENPVEITGPSEFRAGRFNWTWKDFHYNCVVFGMTGSGKTACVLNALLDGLLGSAEGEGQSPSALILDPKGDFRTKIRNVCRRYGRERDLAVLAPHDPQTTIHLNPLDSDESSLELAGRFAAVMESVGMKADKESFWIDSARKFIRHAIDLLRLTNAPGEPPSLAQIGQLASSLQAISRRLKQFTKATPESKSCVFYFADEWGSLADETRSSIQAHITNMLDPFEVEPYRTVFSGRSTYRISDMIDDGRILYVDMPKSEHEQMSRVVCTFVKLDYFREVLRRPDKIRPSFFLCDEFQSYFTVSEGRGDADFFERSRQSRHANIIATQNLPGLKKQTTEEHPVLSLLGNCGIKMFLRNTDRDTNEFASQLFGEKLVTLISSSAGGGGPGALGRFKSSSSGADAYRQYDSKVRHEAFTQLAIPSRMEHTDFCETIVHLASRAWVTYEKLRWRLHLLEE